MFYVLFNDTTIFVHSIFAAYELFKIIYACNDTLDTFFLIRKYVNFISTTIN